VKSNDERNSGSDINPDEMTKKGCKNVFNIEFYLSVLTMCKCKNKGKTLSLLTVFLRLDE